MTVQQAIQAALEHQRAGRLERADEIYCQALDIEPNNPDALHLRGTVALQQGNAGHAAELIQEALAQFPSNPVYLNSHGIALAELGNAAQAELRYREAVRLKPDYADAHYNLANLLRALSRHDEAAQSYRAALTLRPDYIAAFSNLGLTLQALGRAEEAAQCFSSALAIDSNYPEALCHSAHLQQYLCAWEGLRDQADAVRRHVMLAGSGRIPPFMCLALPGSTPAEQFRCARQYAQRHFRSFLSCPPLCTSQGRAGHPRLRLGYLSSDFREHPVHRQCPT